MLKRFVIYTALAVAFVGCFNDEAYDTEIVFRPELQTESGGDFTPLDGAVAYAFAADTTDYRVESYNDALLGILSNKVSGEVLPPLSTASPYSDYDLEYAISLRASLEDVMLLVVDTENECYAYSNYTVGVNLPTTFITVAFRSWKTDDFSQGKWYFVVPESPEIDDTQDEEE